MTSCQYFYVYCFIFTFRIQPDVTTGTALAIFEEAKIKSARYQIQIYFVTHFISPQDAGSVASMHESVHAIIYPKYFSSDEEGHLEISGTPYTEDHHRTLDIIDSYIACLESDREDGLFATVVCDEVGCCLGLVYSNELSLRMAFEKRMGIYWSRSRSEVWEKGLTSGCWQELIQIRHDCDGDALQFIVIQHGEPPAFCHLYTRTCFGPSTGLRRLEELLISRRTEAPEGSYTRRLFDDQEMLKRKLLVEANELFETSDKEAVAAEAADLMYFLMTRCVATGVGIRDIERHLDRRSLKINRPQHINFALEGGRAHPAAATAGHGNSKTEVVARVAK